jgi:hypothetical protein
MKTFVKSILMIISAVLILGGCYQTKQDFTINPNGSGKAVVKITMQMPNMNFGEKQDKNKMLLSNIKNIIDKSKGVEAWSDVTYIMNKKGETEFKGLAYFPDVNKVSFGEFGGWDIRFSPLEADKYKLEIVTSKKDEKKPDAETIQPADKKEQPVELTDAQIKEKIDLERQQYQQTRAFMVPMFENMKTEMTFKLPGKVETVTNLIKEKDGSVAFIFEWKKIMNVIDKMIEDDEWMKEQIKNKARGASGASAKPELDQKFMSQIFPDQGGITALISGSKKNFFDYNKELVAAKKKHDEFMKVFETAK